MLPWSARADCFKLQHCCHRLNTKIILLKVPKLNSKLMDQKSFFLSGCLWQPFAGKRNLQTSYTQVLPKTPYSRNISSIPSACSEALNWLNRPGDTWIFSSVLKFKGRKKPLHHLQVPCKFLQAEHKGEKALPWLCLLWQIPFKLPVCIANVSYF